jgi:deltex-like protein
MRVRVDPRGTLGGAARGSGVIVVEYSVKGGVQTAAHERRGARFHGTERTCYYPHTADGAEAVRLLRRAFDLGRIFKVSTSVTNGEAGQTVWAGIHHKTSRDGGSTRHGYPDDQFLQRLKSECMAHGIS